MPQISIVTAANVYDNRESPLQRWLYAVSTQTLPANFYEIILVDAVNQIDYDAELSRLRAERELVNIHCQRIERAGRARALNRALEIASGNLIIFLGDDCLPQPGLSSPISISTSSIGRRKPLVSAQLFFLPNVAAHFPCG